jgi:hypothetical protein
MELHEQHLSLSLSLKDLSEEEGGLVTCSLGFFN